MSHALKSTVSNFVPPFPSLGDDARRVAALDGAASMMLAAAERGDAAIAGEALA